MDSIVEYKGYISRARWLRQGANSHEHKPGGKKVLRALNKSRNALLVLVSEFRTGTTLQIPNGCGESSGHLD